MLMLFFVCMFWGLPFWAFVCSFRLVVFDLRLFVVLFSLAVVCFMCCVFHVCVFVFAFVCVFVVVCLFVFVCGLRVLDVFRLLFFGVYSCFVVCHAFFFRLCLIVLHALCFVLSVLFCVCMFLFVVSCLIVCVCSCCRLVLLCLCVLLGWGVYAFICSVCLIVFDRLLV